jgi:hypothetical protein
VLPSEIEEESGEEEANNVSESWDKIEMGESAKLGAQGQGKERESSENEGAVQARLAKKKKKEVKACDKEKRKSKEGGGKDPKVNCQSKQVLPKRVIQEVPNIRSPGPGQKPDAQAK